MVLIIAIMFQASMKVHTRGCLEVLGYQVAHLETALFLWLLALRFKIFGYHLNVSIVWKPTPATQSSQIFSVCVISSEFNLTWVSILSAFSLKTHLSFNFILIWVSICYLIWVEEWQYWQLYERINLDLRFWQCLCMY